MNEVHKASDSECYTPIVKILQEDIRIHLNAFLSFYVDIHVSEHVDI
jgi:hypothetical protein